MNIAHCKATFSFCLPCHKGHGKDFPNLSTNNLTFLFWFSGGGGGGRVNNIIDHVALLNIFYWGEFDVLPRGRLLYFCKGVYLFYPAAKKSVTGLFL